MAYTSLDAANLGRTAAVDGAVQAVTQSGSVAAAAVQGGVGIQGDSGNAATYDPNGVPDYGGPLPGGFDASGDPKPAGQFDAAGHPAPTGGFNQYGVPEELGGFDAAGNPQPAGGYDQLGNAAPAGIYNAAGFVAGTAYWRAGMVPGSAPIKP
ncbi:MAG: hypothetical protein KY445_04890 [Armatimonadetes bacterium]|nr:hypothetical protein [Armatimonadota bacterium]